MIHEYAIEPKALIELASNKLACGYIKENFTEGQARVICHFPKKWIKQCFTTESPLDDNAKKNLEGLLTYLKEYAVRRSPSSYDPESTWLTNVENENGRHPFKAILATDCPNSLENILICQDMSEWRKSTLWQEKKSMTVKRTAIAMTKAVTPLLQKASEIHFVDPHFAASESRFTKPLSTMIAAAVQCLAYQQKKDIVYHVSDKWDLDQFYKDCQSNLPALIPFDINIHFKRWRKRSGGDKLHNRFILTNLGGVSFGIGLDTGKKGETDDINLLERSHRIKRWGQYVSNNGDFDLVAEFTIIGKKQIINPSGELVA